MNKTFLISLVLIALPSIVQSQTGSKDSPLPLSEGKVKVDFSAGSSVYYTYTPDCDQMLTFGSMTNVNFYASQVTPTEDRYGESFNGTYYIQTKAGIKYSIEVTKGWSSGDSSFEFGIYPCPWPGGETWETAIVPFDRICYVPIIGGDGTHLKYTPGEDGVLSIFFTSSVTLKYATSADGTYTDLKLNYVTGGGYKNNIEVTGGQTYYFIMTGWSSSMCRFELLHPVVGTSPDFPYTVTEETPGIFPKEAGTYYYKITNNGSDGYLILQGNGSFVGQASVGTSFNGYSNEISNDRIHLRLSVSQYYKEYYLTLKRDETATTDQTFTAEYSTESYDTFPGQEIAQGEYTTPDFAGLYYYTFTVPEDGHNIIRLNTKGIVSDNSKASLYYSDNQYSALTNGSDIKYEAVAGRQYTIAWRVAAEDSPLSFTLAFEAPALGESPANPIPAVAGENNSESVGTIYFKYTATMDGWLYITSTDGIASPLVSMLPTPTDPYQQACEVIADGKAYRVACTKERGYLITFNAEGCVTFTLREQPALTGEAPSVPFPTEDGIASVPEAIGTYWFTYTTPRSGKMEISTNLPYEVSENRQDYTFVRLYAPTDHDNFISELRPDTDQGIFANRILDTEEDVTYLIKVRTMKAEEGKWVKIIVRDPIDGEVADKPIMIPFDGMSGTYLFDVMVNNPTYGIWYGINLPEGVFSMSGTTGGSFEMGMYASENTDTAIAESSQLGIDYDEAEEMYIYTWGIDKLHIEKPGLYLFHVTDNAVPFTMNLSMLTTDLDSISTDSTRVFPTKGGIFVRSASTTIEVYAMDGSLLHRRADGESCLISLEEGIYIVRTGNMVEKVVVR